MIGRDARALVSISMRSRRRASHWVALLLLAASADNCRTIAPKPVSSISVRVAEVRLNGFGVLTPDVLQRLRDRMSLKPGAPLTDAAEQAAANLAVETLQDHGYPYAGVQITREDLDAASTRLIVNAIPGKMGFFGRTDITGNKHVDDAIIRSRLAYFPGELFRRSALGQSEQQLDALELFESVRIEAWHIDQRPVDVPILISVIEHSPWRWNFSPGYAAGERLGLDASVGHMNFLGGARRLELSGRISRIDHLAEVSFIQPQLLTPRLSLSLLARGSSIDDPAFHAVSKGGQAALTWMPTAQFSATFAYAASRERSRVPGGLDPLTTLQDGMLSAWSVDLDHRTLAAASAAPSGPVLMLHLEQAGGWMPGTFNYYNATVEVRDYHTTSDGRITLAVQGRYGSISPMRQESDIPLSKRFFLGGSGQMRGWSRFEVSPLSPSGDPIGGKSLLAATSEIRARLLPKLRGALFAEAGNVWRGDWTAHLDDLKFDAGPGLRIETPFGLIRVDFGYQLNRIEGLRIGRQPERHRWRIDIGIGEAF
jgi:outer membrane protein assembly factor BamA